MLKTAYLCVVLGLGMPTGKVAAEPTVSAPVCSKAALTALNVQDMTIVSATEVAAAPGTPPYCRVRGSATTDGDGAGVNQAGFQIDLPTHWNGKFLFLGGGGMDGNAVLRDGAPQQVAKGYAIASTNAGHPDANGTFAITAPGVPNRAALADYFYRAHHQVGIVAKKLILAFYKAPKIAYSYFMGCSGGGRQGLMEASRYPDDYDGIVSGAPAMDLFGVVAAAKNVRALVPAYIPYSLFPQINTAIMAQCDVSDGVKDGIIQNPARCAFDPDSLVPSVLTRAQADAIKTIIAPVTDPAKNLIYPGSPVSDLFGQWGPLKLPVLENATPAPHPMDPQPWGAPPLTFGVQSPLSWYIAYNAIDYLGLYQPDNNLNSDNFENKGAVPVATRKTLDTNLKPGLTDDPAQLVDFIGKGKKLIIYHGYSDPILTPYRTVLFYEALAGTAGGYARLQDSARLFMVPDMGHCTNGNAPDVFGNTAEPAAYPIDAQHDVLSALEEWVENGRAPADIIATHYTGDDAMTGKIDRTMPLCPFPTEARYSGSGDINDAMNWTCKGNAALLETGVNGKQAGLSGPDK
jgi:feruloyl esterase